MEFYFSFNENCLHTACKTKSFNLIQYLISLDKDLLEATDIFIFFLITFHLIFFIQDSLQLMLQLCTEIIVWSN